VKIANAVRSVGLRFNGRQTRERAWQHAVTAQLDDLGKSQKLLRDELSRLTEPVPRKVRRAGVTLLVAVGIGVALSATLSVLASSYNDQASALRAQAQADVLQGNQLLAPELAIMESHSPKYLVAHATKFMLSQQKLSDESFRQAQTEFAEADRVAAGANIALIAAQILLPVMAAIFGAIAGWVLTPILTGTGEERRDGTAEPTQ
jgi:hypothetical protein